MGFNAPISGTSPTFVDVIITGDLTVNGDFDFGSASVQSLFIGDDDTMKFGNTAASPDASLGWNTAQTVDGLFLGLATAQNTFVIAEQGDIAFDFAHGAQIDPTLFIHSAAQSTTQWLSLSHNQTSAVIGTGLGGVSVTPATITSGGTNDFGIQVAQTLNDTGAAGGSDVYRALYANITTTDITGWNNVYLLDLVDDATSRFNINSRGIATHTVALVGGDTSFSLTYSTSGTSASTLSGPIVTLNAGYTGTGITQALGFDNILAGTNTSYSTDGTYGSRPGGNRGVGGYARGTTTGVNTGVLGLARGGIQNWAGWLGSTDAEANKSNVGVIGLGFNDATGGEGIGVYALYDNPSAVPNIGADTKTALLADNAANAVDIAIFRDNGTAVWTLGDGGGITHTKATAGAALDLNITATTYTNDVGAIDIVRSGALTGVAGEVIVDFALRPAFTLTEPASGSVEFIGFEIDLSGVQVTAGAGTSELTALLINASTDTDAGTNKALWIETGSSEFNGAVVFAPAAVSSGSPIGIDYQGPSHTSLTASTANNSVKINPGTKSWATGALTLQGDIQVLQGTYAFTAASTVTLGATMIINGGPNEGSNATITSGAALMLGGSNTVDIADNYSNLFVVPNPVAAGVGNLNGWYGVNYTSGQNVSLGNQTASMDELAAYKNSAVTFESTTNTRTVTLAAGAIFNAPVAGSNVTFTNVYGLVVDSGRSRFDGAIIGNQGTDIASASTIVIPTDGNTFELTGTTAVNLITTTGWRDGFRITLIANENVTINHGTATSGSDVTILLAGSGNFAMTANDTLTLELSTTTAGGQAWREISRTAI